MNEADNGRPIGNTPITDAAAATAPQPQPTAAEYPANVSSNADLRVGEDDRASDAAVTATGADIDNDHADERPVDRSNDAPETFHGEQDDEGAQAQTVADDAVHWKADQVGYGNSESEHANPAQVEPDDAQDAVDHMNQMERSGSIDMDAYRGERSDDDEPQTLGQGALDPDDIDEHGNRPRDQQYSPVE
jgi:hypothetical protein